LESLKERDNLEDDDNIKIYLIEISLEGLDWTQLAQDRYRWRALVNTVMDLRDA
jgi:hypothetical protein